MFTKNLSNIKQETPEIKKSGEGLKDTESINEEVLISDY